MFAIACRPWPPILWGDGQADWGDPATLPGTQSHTYLPGTYTLTLSATDSDGDTSPATHTYASTTKHASVSFSIDDGSAQGATSDPYDFDFTPNAPNSLSATALSASEVLLRWTDTSSIEDGFTVEASTDAGLTFNPIELPSANADHAVISWLDPQSSYVFRIRANNGSADSAWSNTATTTTLSDTADVPAAPGNFTAARSTASPTSVIDLTWSASTNATGYAIESSTDGGYTYTRFDTVTASTLAYSASKLDDGTRYDFRVRAFGGAGLSDPSSSAYFSTQLIAPTDFTITAESYHTLKFTWNDNTTHNRAYVIADGSIDLATVGRDETEYRLTTADPSHAYTYRIRAINNTYPDAFSAWTSANVTTPASTAPAAPSDLTAVGASNASIDVHWHDNSDDERNFLLDVRYQYAGNPATEWDEFFLSIDANSTGISLPVDPASAPTTYWFRVRSENGYGQMSEYTSEVSATALADSRDIGGEGVPCPNIIDLDAGPPNEVFADGNEDDPRLVGGLPGLLVAADRNDVDHDGIPGFADYDTNTVTGDASEGLGRFGDANIMATHNGFQVITLGFVGLGPSTTFTLKYSAADPASVDDFTTDDLTDYVPGSSNLARVWLRPGDQYRNPAPFASGGDYLAPTSGTGVYTLSDLRSSSAEHDGDFYTFYVEGINAGTGRIEVHATDPDAPSDAQNIYDDAIRFTVLSTRLDAYRTGERRADKVARPTQLMGDPYTYVTLTNRDHEEHPGLPVSDFADDLADIQIDNDLAKLVLNWSGGVNTGQLSLNFHTPPQVPELRVFDQSGVEVYRVSAGHTSMTLDLSHPFGPLKPLATGGLVTLYVEGLSDCRDVRASLAYSNGSDIVSDDVHMAFATMRTVNASGYDRTTVPRVPAGLLHDFATILNTPDPVTDADKFWWQIDNLPVDHVHSLHVTSDMSSKGFDDVHDSALTYYHSLLPTVLSDDDLSDADISALYNRGYNVLYALAAPTALLTTQPNPTSAPAPATSPVDKHPTTQPLPQTIDLDIDSDNDDAYAPPKRSDFEEEIEDLPGQLGKALRLNDNDTDFDGVPDFADGIDRWGNKGANASAPFYRIVLQLPQMAADDTITFSYDASDPGKITRGGDKHAGYTYAPAAGALRLWTRDGTESRNLAVVGKDGGDYLAPATYKAGDFPTILNGGTFTYYLEAVAAFNSKQITVTLNHAALSTSESDTVKVSLVDLKLEGDGGPDHYIRQQFETPNTTMQDFTPLDLLFPADLPAGTTITLSVDAQQTDKFRAWTVATPSPTDIFVLGELAGASVTWTVGGQTAPPHQLFLEGRERTDVLKLKFSVLVSPPAPAPGIRQAPAAVTLETTVGAEPIYVGFYGADIWATFPNGNEIKQNGMVYRDGNKEMGEIFKSLGANAKAFYWYAEDHQDAYRWLLAQLDTNHSKTYDPVHGFRTSDGTWLPPDKRRSIRILGHSWGGHNAIELAWRIADSEDHWFKVPTIDILSVIDPVDIGRGDAHTVGSAVRLFWNRFQTGNHKVTVLWTIGPSGRPKPSEAIYNDGNRPEDDLNPPPGERTVNLSGQTPYLDHWSIIPYVEPELLPLLRS